MTYISTQRPAARRYGRRARSGGLGGLFDFIEDLAAAASGTSGDAVRAARDQVCRAEADADTSVAQMASQIADIERTWNPTGFFTPDQLATVLEATLAYSQTARSQMQTALSNVNIDDSGKEASRREFDSAYSDFQGALDRSAIFIDALNKARASGVRAVDAPGLKVWVMQVLNGSHKLARAAAFVTCNVSGFERFVRAVNAAVDRLLSILRTVAGVVLAAGEKALSVAGDFFGLAISLMKFAPFILIAGGGLYLYRQYRDR